MHRYPDHRTESRVDPALDRLLRRLIGWGVLAVLLLPVARGYSAWFGWMPLWLVAMPLASWWALHHFRLPRLRPRFESIAATRRRRRGGAQARRRRVPAAGTGVARAA